MSTIANYARAWKFQFGSIVVVSNSVFVDSFAGDDLRGLGTKDFPFQTLNKAFVYANANTKMYIICRGYFSETIPSGFSKQLLSDRTGDAIWDGQSIYSIFTTSQIQFGGSVNIETAMYAMVIINAYGTIATGYNYGSILINTSLTAAQAYNYSVVKGINYQSIANYGTGVAVYNAVSNLAVIDFYNSLRGSGSGIVSKCIYDNCKIYLDKVNTSVYTFNTCLFRVNCTFWKRNIANTADERVDNDNMNAQQKYAAVIDWLANGALPTSYYKNVFTNCQITDNRIFNCPDNDRSGMNWDFSLIYGTKESQPACFMDGGKHIGPFPPALKLEFKNTADLTSSAYEIEVKTTDNINNIGGSLFLGANFTGATLYSKAMLIPQGTSFNGFNISLFPDTANSGVFVTGQTDSIDTSEGNKITITSGGIALSANVSYLVKVEVGTTVVYNGTSYVDKSVLMATDSVTLASKGGSGTAFLYAIKHPSLWQSVQFKVCENATVPADFKTNDAAYKWLDAEIFSKNVDVRGTSDTGLRCLRVGNINSGAIDVGTDGKALTSAHPEFYNSTNQARIKYYVRANYVMMKITIARLFN